MTNLLTASFTGTRKGMTPAQKTTVKEVLVALKASTFVHGDCIGADADAHVIAATLELEIHLRPCTLSNMRAYCQGAQKTYPPKKPLPRNRDIVHDGRVLVATPGEFEEVLRSGTWSTVRYARNMAKPVCIVWPDGTYTAEGWM